MAERYLGIMSGTSLDGVDAALVEVDVAAGGVLGARLEAFLSIPYDEEQRLLLKQSLAGGAEGLCRLNVSLGEWFAAAAARLLEGAGVKAADVAAVGSHGQTVWHDPPAPGRIGATLQLGEPAVIAERLGVPVVSDFRARDVAAGGQGAPLVPLVDQLLFTVPDSTRAMQNIGGIANVTLLPPAGSSEPVIAFDTGPGVAVVDAVVEIVSEGAETFDQEGRRAMQGRVSEELITALLDDPYFTEPPPKSTGRERYGERYAIDLIGRGRELGLNDDDLVASARRLDPIPVTDLSALGWDPDAKEAAAFAILAHLFQAGVPGNLPSVTGAAGPRVLGKLTPP